MLLILGMFCAACGKFGEGRQTWRELIVLRDKLAKEFREPVVDVSLSTDRRLTVKFVDSPTGPRTRAEKQARADAVAAFVAKHYKQPLQEVAIRFVSKGSAGGLSIGIGETFVGKRLDAPRRTSLP